VKAQLGIIGLGRKPIPRGTDFASVIRSDVPIVVQHTRLDSRQPALALMSTIAFPGSHTSPDNQ
jgi:hypothetical protein